MKHKDLHDRIAGLTTDVEDYRSAILKAMEALMKPFGLKLLSICQTCKKGRHTIGETCPNCGEIDQ